MESYTANNLLARQFNLFCLDFNQNNKEDLPLRFKQNKRKKRDGDKKETEAFALIPFRCPIDGIEVIDIRIKGKLNEDEIYLNSDTIFKTIRRGNSIIHKLNSEMYSMGRMGLPKFFDYLKKNSQSSYEKSIQKRVIDPIKQTKGPYSVYLTEKANGENFQVSFNTEHQAWIVGSKNVSLLVRDEKDIEWYISSPDIIKMDNDNNNKKSKIINEDSNTKKKEDYNRYQYCIEFATLWLGIVKNKIGNLINDFKRELGDHTLIGENVGNQGYQHIKYYKEKDAIFYAIINNTMHDKEICLPLSKSFPLLEKYNLSHVPFESSESFNTIEELIAYLNTKYDEILLKKVSEGGEGSVAYLNSLDGGKETVLGLAKLKTFEYRFLRKIREKSKVIHKQTYNASKAFELLKKESLNLIEDLKHKVDYDSYLELGNYMLKYAERDETNYSNVFADFISIMKESFANGIKVEDLNIQEIKAKLIKANSDIPIESKDDEKEDQDN